MVSLNNENDKNNEDVEISRKLFGNALDSGLVRSILAVPIVIIIHFILEKQVEGWSTQQLILSVVFLTVPAVAWIFFPRQVISVLNTIWALWHRVYPIVGAIALIALITVVVYWMTQREPIKPKIRFTCDTWVGWAPLYIAKEKKFFGNTDFEIIQGHGSGEKRKFVYRGDADAIGETVDMLEFSSSAAAVAPGVILWAADRSNGGDVVVASKEITSVPKLVDKAIGLETGTPTHYMLLRHFQMNNLPSDRLNIRDLLGPDATKEFKEERLDATAAWHPHIQEALTRKDSYIILSSKDMTGDYSVRDVVAVNRIFLDKHPDAVRDFFIGWCAALLYIKTNPQDAYKIMADNMRITTSELKKELKEIEFYGYQENVNLFISSQESEIVKNVLTVRSVWQNAGFARDVDSIESRVSSEIIKSVKQEDIDLRLKDALSNTWNSPKSMKY
jgi:NitT/TauT family transport system substrate-binding protein